MKLNKIYILLIISISAIFSSCTEEIDLELNESFARLVVEGNISTDTMLQQINLSKSTSYFYNQKPPIISGGIVKVTDGLNTYNFSELPDQPGTYQSDQVFAGVQGATYDLSIENVDLGDNSGIKTYKAQEKMKSILVIDSIYAIPANFFGIQGYRVFGFAQEPATEGDFYIWRYYVNSKLITDTLDKTTFGSDQLVNGNYLSNLELGFFREGKPGDTLTVETNSVTEDYFNYIITFFIETSWSGGGGFGGPPANIRTNINNGAVGYYNTEARSKISIILP